MKKRKFLTYLLLVVMMITTAFCLTGCGSDENTQETAVSQEEEVTEPANPDEGIMMDVDESEIASNIEKKANSVSSKDAKKLNSDAANFYGSWTATSARAHDMYGNIDLTINKDGTFDANVTEEIFSGTWEKTDYGIHFESELIVGAMYYNDKCKMTFDEDDFTVNLEKVK